MRALRQGNPMACEVDCGAMTMGKSSVRVMMLILWEGGCEGGRGKGMQTKVENRTHGDHLLP